MDQQPAFGFKELFHHVVGDMAKAISERAGETKSQQFARSQAAVHMIMGFLPRDVTEAMLAGHCVMFHELMIDSAHHTLCGEPNAQKRATRGNIIAMNKAFHDNLTLLDEYQARPSAGSRESAEARPAHDAVVDIKPDVVPNPETAPATETPAEATECGPSAEMLAACRANPAAMAALEAGDAEAFAHALGIDEPGEEFLAAANAPGSPFLPANARSPASGKN